MLVLITYDVNTEALAGRKRLRRVSKLCVDYGQRVQNSVFECNIDAMQLRVVKDKLLKEINFETDSLRFYFLGNNYKSKVEHYGAKASFDVTDPLVL
ncbi:MAG: CRISPR-associated endonuclease Cas2 [Coriobacteriales bacterium]|jgi:CRISPR-associated protein Cas2|nr:CRISPR-associated endonuclease Cas2 [Coriobacteriales bacterium]